LKKNALALPSVTTCCTRTFFGALTRRCK